MSNAERRRHLTNELRELEAKEQVLRASFPAEPACCEADCFEDADWVRVTQFAGDHPYCDLHARQEEDFGKKDDSYFFWVSVGEFLEIDERRRKWKEEAADKFLDKRGLKK